MPQGASSLPIVALACAGFASGCGKTGLKEQIREQDLERRTLERVSEQVRPMDSPWLLTSLTSWPAWGRPQ